MSFYLKESDKGISVWLADYHLIISRDVNYSIRELREAVLSGEFFPYFYPMHCANNEAVPFAYNSH